MLTAKRIYENLGNETLWDAAVASHALLAGEGLPHALVGDVAVCLHGYQRNTVDIDMLVRPTDSGAIRQSLLSAGWQWDADSKQFISDSGIVLQFLLAGERAGSGSELRFPNPADGASIVELEGLPILTLARLIETKLASGTGNVRRMHKDYADVVELISYSTLSSFHLR